MLLDGERDALMAALADGAVDADGREDLDIDCVGVSDRVWDWEPVGDRVWD